MRGWELKKSGDQWTYTDTTGEPIGGIVGMTIADWSRLEPGLVRVTVNGVNGPYPVEPGDEPLRVAILLEDITLPVCSDSAFVLDDCTFTGPKGTLMCQKKR
jgi:hypothetical protein